MRIVKVFVGVLACVAFMVISGCQTAPKTEAARENLADEAQLALNHMKSADPSLGSFMSNAYGYAIFPSVGKGGVIAGGAYGRGIVYEQGKMIGYSDLTQATVGLQLGGQTYRELVVFQNQAAMDRVKSGKLAFSANASAVALKSGAAAAARYIDGAAIFVQPTGGAMVEASVGGQQLTYEPLSQVNRDNNSSMNSSGMNNSGNMNGSMNTNTNSGGGSVSGHVEVEPNK